LPRARWSIHRDGVESINRNGYVAPYLQEKVLLAMELLHYQPSALARGLRRQETQTVGVLVPQLARPFFSSLGYVIERTLFANQYRAFLCSAEEDREKESAYIEMLYGNGPMASFWFQLGRAWPTSSVCSGSRFPLCWSIETSRASVSIEF
jgi:hypothetical protein